MSAHALRRAADLARLRELAARSGARLHLVDAPERAGRPIRIRLDLTTVRSARYPAERQHGVMLRFDLPSRYPFERPVITVETPIFHPNVFSSGVVCQGEKWLPGHGIDVVIRRMVNLSTFAPFHVNPASAANRAAADWYLQKCHDCAALFPTDTLDLAGSTGPRVQAPTAASATTTTSDGAAVEQGSGRVIRPCTHCGRPLRLPSGRNGIVQCPACTREFAVST